MAFVGRERWRGIVREVEYVGGGGGVVFLHAATCFSNGPLLQRDDRAEGGEPSSFGDGRWEGFATRGSVTIPNERERSHSRARTADTTLRVQCSTTITDPKDMPSIGCLLPSNSRMGSWTAQGFDFFDLCEIRDFGSDEPMLGTLYGKGSIYTRWLGHSWANEQIRIGLTRVPAIFRGSGVGVEWVVPVK